MCITAACRCRHSGLRRTLLTPVVPIPARWFQPSWPKLGELSRRQTHVTREERRCFERRTASVSLAYEGGDQPCPNEQHGRRLRHGIHGADSRSIQGPKGEDIRSEQVRSARGDVPLIVEIESG